MQWRAPQADKQAFDNLEAHDACAKGRSFLRLLSEKAEEWAGIPLALEGEELIVEPSYPFASIFKPKRDTEPVDYKVRNTFYSRRHRCDVVIFEEADGRITHGLLPRGNSIAQAVRTLGCSAAWGIEQESNALQLLATLLPHHAFKHYLLTGTFLERSRRSGVMYLFRKLRPTVAFSMRGEEVKFLAALCLHPIAYYQDSWAGAMCPSDDICAHLQLMRGDEHLFWRRAVQHAAHEPEAGI